MPVATVSSRMLALAEEKRAVTAFTQRILGDRGSDNMPARGPSLMSPDRQGELDMLSTEQDIKRHY